MLDPPTISQGIPTEDGEFEEEKLKVPVIWEFL